MLYNDIKIKIPNGTKLGNEKKYVYYVLEKTYNPVKKYYTYKTVNIGKVAVDGVNMHPNHNYFKYYELNSVLQKEIPLKNDVLSIGMTLIIDKIFKELKWEDLFNKVFLDQYQLIKICLQYILSKRTFNFSNLSNWSFSNFCWDSDYLFDDKVLNKMISSEKIDQIMSFIYKNNVLNVPKKNKEKTCLCAYIEKTFLNNNDIFYPYFLLDINKNINILFQLYPEKLDLDTFTVQEKSLNDSQVHFFNCFNKLDEFLKIKNKDQNFIIRLKNNDKVVNDFICSNFDTINGDFDFFIPEYKVFYKVLKGSILGDEYSDLSIHMYYDSIKAGKEIKKFREKASYYLKKFTETRNIYDSLKNQYKYYIDIKTNKNGEIDYVGVNKETACIIKKTSGIICFLSNFDINETNLFEIFKQCSSAANYFDSLKTDIFCEEGDLNFSSRIFLFYLSSIIRGYYFSKTSCVSEKDFDYSIGVIEKISAYISPIDKKYEQKYALNKEQIDILASFGLNEKNVRDFIIKMNKVYFK